MQILMLSQYFWPESFIINDIVRILDEKGHQVTVATGKPNYPEGDVFKGYSARGVHRELFLGHIDVIRVPLWPRGRGGSVNLILNYLSFIVTGLFLFPWLLRKKKFDAILVFGTSPITQAIPAILIKRLKQAKLVLWVQDLWPESLSATGFVKRPLLLKGVGWLVMGIYHGCDMLLVQSKSFIDSVAQYSNIEKIFYYPNSIDININNSSTSKVPDELAEILDTKFCVVFGGNLGKAQALDTLLQAALILRDDKNIRLILVGSGSRLEWLREQKQLLKLDNLILPGRFPFRDMPKIYDRASALLLSLNSSDIFSKTIPSKMQAYLASGRPIIASINGEGARVVTEAGAGFVSPAEHVMSLVENIRCMAKLSYEERLEMGKSGKKYFDANFEMNSQVDVLVKLLSLSLNSVEK